MNLFDIIIGNIFKFGDSGGSNKGYWDANANNPVLTSGIGDQYAYYVVSVAGNTNLDGITDWQIGDVAWFDGTVWKKEDNTQSVISVNGYDGIVVLSYSDVGAEQAFTKNTAFNKNFGNTSGTVCEGSDSRLSDARIPLSHIHGNISNGGAIGLIENLPIITGASGILQVGSFGNSVNTFCQGNDSRIPSQDENDALVGTNGTPSSTNKYVTNTDPRNSDARTPLAHNQAGSTITLDTSTFLNLLSSADDTVQKALQTLNLHHQNPIAQNYDSSTQTFTANNSYKKFTIGTQLITPRNIAISGTTDFTVLQAGVYKISYCYTMEATTTLVRTFIAQIRKNDSTYLPETITKGYVYFDTDKQTISSTEIFVTLNANDFISLMIRVTNGFTSARISYVNLKIEKVI